jgi:MOSC domain-containing protein YiiM
MFRGKVLGIYITSNGGMPMQAIEEAHAVPGKGLQGDRYFLETGTYSARPGPVRQVTFFEAETLKALERRYKYTLTPDKTRRNILTEGVPLNHLEGKEFMVGSVRFRGLTLCEPCEHLANLTGIPNIVNHLLHRGGLNAEILNEGIIRVGDVIEEV